MRFARPYIVAFGNGISIALGVALIVMGSPIIGMPILATGIGMTIVYLKDDLL